MFTASKTVTLKYGTVVLREWGDHVTDAFATDLMTITVILDELRGAWMDIADPDAEQDPADQMHPEFWPTFWRLVNASLDGTPLPHRVTWTDRATLLDAMWDLNSIEDALKKWSASTQRARRVLAIQQELGRLPSPTGMNS